MPNNYRSEIRTFLAIAVVISSIVVGGCKKDLAPELADKAILNEEESNAVNSVTTSVAVTKDPGANSLPSPAAAENKVPPVDASPEIVCEKFLKLLQAGNRLTAEQLLTRTAMTVIAKAHWELSPLGSSTAKFEVDEAMYATTKQEIAQVSCQIIDTEKDNTTPSSVTWLVRKKNEGWRISGMLLPSDDSGTLDLISFENMNDVQLMMHAMSVDADSSAESLSQN